MKRLTTLALLALIGIVLPEASPALEADCAACDFCRDKKDIAGELTARIQEHLAAGRSAAEIADAEGGGSIIRSHIEVWANKHPESAKPARSRLKYRGSTLPDNALFSSYAHCVKVGDICIGTDKLGHLFQQGWEFHRISVTDGKGDRLAERYGEWLEGKEPRENYSDDEAYFRRQPSGRIVGYGGFGRAISGVISNADLAASKAGLQMYKDLSNHCFKSITDYVTDALCEEKNPNDYTPEMKRIVEHNRPR